ncbi:MAG: shikimate kinase [Actinomycetia bacterium]|nr:shikimate kinase [Actinomycetes bacterium]
MKSIAMIGFMGSGKSTIGSLLARTARLSFIDLDDIAMELAEADVADVFANQGEDVWRDWEHQALEGMADIGEQIILACGGGIIIKPENRRILEVEFLTIYLKTSQEVLVERLRNPQDRPLLDVPDPEAAIAKLFEERRELYEETAHTVVITDKKTPKEIVDEILKILNEE